MAKLPKRFRINLVRGKRFHQLQLTEQETCSICVQANAAANRVCNVMGWTDEFLLEQIYNIIVKDMLHQMQIRLQHAYEAEWE